MRSVLFLITGLEYGGAEVQLAGMCGELRARDWHCEVVSMIAPGPVAGVLRDAGVRVHTLGMRRGVPSPLGVWRLARLVRGLSPSLVHSHLIHANLLARAARPWLGRAPLINSGHSSLEGARWLIWGYRLTDPCCDLFQTVSREAERRYTEQRIVSPNKLFHLPNAVHVPVGLEPGARARVRSELGLGEAFTALCVGRLEVEKDHAVALEAFAQLARKRPAWLLVVGTGRQRGSLERLADELGIAQRVHWLGERHDVPDLMRAAEVFVLSSRWEGLPITLLEAGVHDLPVIATAVGDVPDLISHGHNGWLVAPRDPDGLARQLIEVAAGEPSVRREVGRELGVRVRREFDIARVAERWIERYEALIASRGVAPGLPSSSR